MTGRDVALALLVALRLDNIAPGVCPAWIESAGRRCGKPAMVGLLCGRHHAVAEKRRKAIRSDRAARLPGWKARLAEVEAELAAMHGVPLDRAAYTGNVHPTITRANRLSDSRAARGARLEREASQLRALIGTSEKEES